MTSSSTDPAVVRGLDRDAVRPHAIDTDLRSGSWTRLGGAGVLGDTATESALQALAETARTAARAQGYASGWAEGRRAAERAALAEAEQYVVQRAAERAAEAAEHEQAVAALRLAAQRLDAATAKVCSAVETHAVEISLQLAEAVLGRELALAEQPAADAMRRALELMPSGTAVTVRLHPADRDGLDLAAFADHCVTVVADPTLRRGDALVETDVTVVDATVDAALARVREVLSP